MGFETYVTLPKAVQRYGLDAETSKRFVKQGQRYGLDANPLTRSIEEGQILGGKLDGVFVLQEKDARRMAEQEASRQQLREKVDHLEGQPIGIREASRKYDINHASLGRWARQGHIRTLSSRESRGQKILVDESDVAYTKEIMQLRQVGQGKQVFAQEYVPDWFQDSFDDT